MINFFNSYFMEKNRYCFDHVWEINADPDRVWDELVAFELWPGWWEGLETIEDKDSGRPLGRGSRIRSTWKGALPYSLTFDASIQNFIPGARLSFFVSGDLTGYGDCRFRPCKEGTRIRFSWNVAPNKLWIKLSAPFAHSMFRENHDQVLAQAVKGIDKIFKRTEKDAEMPQEGFSPGF
ncbi:SRPBCC family protein [Desulfospira joergensenii]|uniref:SRPBCC family protein n=1 Tax=Desulfospira joergensenii TaxID=53329 RepID=UPI0003B64107|nr:SRPBCC family protein [Desulfospira joergensenii]